MICFPSTEAASSQEAASVLLDSAPRERWIGGTFSTVFGGMSATRGILILSDKNRSQAEHVGGSLLLAFGAIRVLDGVDRLFNASSWEQRGRRLGDYSTEAQREFAFRFWLRRTSEQARQTRWFRSGLLAANGLTYLTLYGLNGTQNKGLVYPGVTLMILATVRAIFPSTAERAWGNLTAGSDGLQWSVNL